MEVYRSNSSNGTYTKVATITGDSYQRYSFTDSSVTSGQRYYYKVHAGMRYGNGYKYTEFSDVKSIIAK